MIEKLTPEQEARLPEFRDFGLRIGLSTERTDRPTAEKAIRDHYRACGLPEPEIRWFDSPYASVRASVRASVWASVGDSVRASVGDSVRASVRASVGASVRASVWDSVGDSVWASVWDSVRASVGDSVGASVRASVGASVRASVGAHYDADFASWVMAWDAYGVSLDPRALTYMAVSEQVWWWYPGKDVVFASDRPTAIHRDDNGRLHCETGKAIEFADGNGFSAWHGTTIPDHWVTQRETIDPSEILKEPNVETRAAGCACVGWPRMLSALDYKIIDSDSNPSHGELIDLTLPGLPEPGRFLKAECPRNGTICEGVPREIKTVIAAQAWRVGLAPDEFSYPEIRT